MEEKMKKLLISVLIGLFVLVSPQIINAQFGKNLVIYDKINWKIYESPHFEIYYYIPSRDNLTEEIELEYIEDMVRWTEAAYKQISEKIDYEMPIKDSKKKKGHGKPRIFFFWARFHADHHPLGPGGAIAYAEPQQMRMVCVSKEYPEKKLQQIVTHEVCHLIQFSLWNLAKKPYFQLARIWPQFLTFLFEGWSQHASGLHRTEPSARLVIRYFVLDKVIRYVNIIDWIKYHGAFEIAYVLAGYFYDYLEETYGKDIFKDLVEEFRRAKPTAQGFEKTVTQLLKTDFAELDRGFRKYLENQYKHFPVEKKEALEYGRDILVRRELLKPLKRVDAAYESVMSPSNDLIAAFTVRGDMIRVDLINKEDGTVLKSLTKGYSLYKYGLWPIVDLDGPGRALSFSPNGNSVLYFAQTAGRNPVLILINFAYKLTTKKRAEVRGPDIVPGTIVVPAITVTDKKVKKTEIPLNDPESPEMSKDGKTVIFSAMQNGQRDIFSLNLETKEIKNLTSDEQFDYGPSFAPDEKTIVYVADVSGYKKLFSLNLETQEKTQLTFGESNETRPIYSKDGKTIWFISDADKDKTRNIYSLDIENNGTAQWTDVINGVRTIAPMPDNKLLFGAVGYRDSQHFFSNNLYEMDLGKIEPVAKTNQLLKPRETEASQQKDEIGLRIDPGNVKKYSTKFHVNQLTLYAGADSRFGLFGYGYMHLADLTNTKHILANVMSFGDYYKYNTLAFYNASRRLTWGIVASQEDHHFWPWFVDWGWNPYGQPAIDVVLQYLKLKRLKLDVFALYPLDLFHRLEFCVSNTSIKHMHPDWKGAAEAMALEIEIAINDPVLKQLPGYEAYIAYLVALKEDYGLRADFIDKYINDGKFATFRIGFVRDTALYKQFGPFVNDMYRIDLSWSTGGYNAMISAEARKYFRLSSEMVLAFRGYAGAQWGKTITPWIIGDLGELRGYQWMQFMGNRIAMTNIELRFPLTKNFNLLGIYLGDIRAALFMDLAQIWFDDKRFNALNVDDVNPGLVKGSMGLDLLLGTYSFYFFSAPVHLAISKRITEFKFLPKLEDKWQLKLYFGYSF